MERRVCHGRMRVAWLVAALCILSLGSPGCRGPRIVVEVDEAGRTGWGERSPTWDWAPDAVPWVEVPEGATADFQPRLAALVSRALGARGFVRTRERPDVHVRYQLSVQRTRLVTYHSKPAKTITGSLVQGHYEVHGVLRTEQEYDDLRLEIHVSRALDGRPLWVARLRERLPEHFEPHLAIAVASVFESFPQAPSTSAGVLRDPEPASGSTPRR